MPIIATGQATIIDINDIVEMRLTHDNAFIPVDSAGVPFSVVSVATTITILKGSIPQNGWQFDVTNHEVSSIFNSETQTLTITGITADSGYVDITASKEYEITIVKRFSATKVYQGQVADPSILQAIQGELSEQGIALSEQGSDLLSLAGRMSTVEGDTSTNIADILSLSGRVSTTESTISTHTNNLGELNDSLLALISTVDTQGSNITILESASGSHAATLLSHDTALGTHATNISDLTTRLGTAENGLSSTAGELSSVVTRVTANEGILTSHGTLITQNDSAISAIALRVDETEGDISTLSTSVTQNAAAITSIASRVTSTEAIVSSHSTSISQNATAISSVALRVDETEGDISTLSASVTQTAEDITTVASRVTTAEGAISTQATLITQNASGITSLASDLTTVEGVVSGHSTSINQNATDITSVASRVSTAEGSIIAHGTSITQNADDISTVATRVTSAEGALTTHSTSINQNANAITAVAGRTTTLEGSVSLQGTSIAQNADAIVSVATRTTTLEGTVSGHDSTIVTHTTSINQNADAITSIATRATTLEGTVATQGTSIIQNSGDITALATRVSSAEGTITSHTSSISQNASGISTLVTRVDSIDGTGGMLEQHTSSISQNADNIGLRVEAVDTLGDAITGAKLEVGVVDGASYILLDADKVIIDGSIKAQKIDTDDLFARELVIKDGGSIQTDNGNVRISSDGSITAINATLVGGTFSGSVEHPSFETVIESEPSAPITLASKTRWKADTLYNALTNIATGNTLKTASGTYDGLSINAATRLAGTDRLLLHAYSSGSIIESYGYKLITTFTVPEDTDRLYYWWDINGANGSGDVFITKNTTSTSSKWVNISTDNYTYGDHQVVSGYRTDFVAGDVLRFYTYRTDLYGTNFQLHSAPYDKGTIVRTTDTSLHYFKDAGFYETPVSVATPNTFTSNINFALASTIAGQFSTYTSGSTYKAEGTLIVEGTPRTLTNLMRDGSNITFYFNVGSPAVLTANDAIGATIGSYDISGSVSVVSQEAGILVRSITPMVDATSSTTVGGTDIGNGDYRIRNITGAGNISGFSNISATTINSQGTTNIVWGAVAN